MNVSYPNFIKGLSINALPTKRPKIKYQKNIFGTDDRLDDSRLSLLCTLVQS